jgi:hypothetical protein
LSFDDVSGEAIGVPNGKTAADIEKDQIIRMVKLRDLMMRIVVKRVCKRRSVSMGHTITAGVKVESLLPYRAGSAVA